MTIAYKVWTKIYTVRHAAVCNATLVNNGAMESWGKWKSRAACVGSERIRTKDVAVTGVWDHGCCGPGSMELPSRTGRVVSSSLEAS